MMRDATRPDWTSGAVMGAFALTAFALTATWAVSRTLEEARPSGPPLVAAAEAFVESLAGQQRATTLIEYDSPQRVDWHFIPKSDRKGLQIKDMQPQQKSLALRLLQSCLSDVGYGKATKIMEIESLLRELEKDRTGTPLRDPQRYYFALFGDVKTEGKWGLSIEGHHLSLNFVVDGGQVVSSTPAVFAVNPAEIKNEAAGGPPKGLRLLANEEELAFELLAALDDPQRAKAIIDSEPLREIRGAGDPQPPQSPAVGIAFSELNARQQATLKKLVLVYAANMPADVAQKRMSDIEQANWRHVHFAWAGAQKPGVGHYYRLQGPTFVIEFVNTQPDAAGNPANHIHTVWRDMRGDFAIPVAQP